MTGHEDFYSEGYKVTLTNAESLQEVAELAYRRKSYGAACALNILSAEEGIKAMFLLLKHIFPNAEILDFEAAFKDNKLNHDYIENFIAVYDLTMQKLHESIEPQWESFIKIKKQPFSSRKKVHPHFDELYTSCLYLMEYKDRELSIRQLVDWLQGANADKHNGLYAGISNTTWQSPQNFEPEKYVAEKRLAKEVLLMARQIEVIHRQLSTWLK